MFSEQVFKMHFQILVSFNLQNFSHILFLPWRRINHTISPLFLYSSHTNTYCNYKDKCIRCQFKISAEQTKYNLTLVSKNCLGQKQANVNIDAAHQGKCSFPISLFWYAFILNLVFIVRKISKNSVRPSIRFLLPRYGGTILDILQQL